MALLAALTAVAAEGLAAYTLAELLASLYEPGEQRALSAVAFVLASLIAYAHLRVAAWYGLDGAGRLLWLTALPYAVLYGTLRLAFSGDLALWDFRWAIDFVRGVGMVSEQGGPALLAAALLVAIWVRSALRAADPLDLELIPRALALPFAVVTVLVLLGVPSDRSGEVARAGAAFYFLGLLSMATSQLALSGVSIGAARAGGVTAILFAAVLAGIVAGVLLLTLVFGVAAPRVGPVLGDVVTVVLTAVLYPIAWVLQGLVSLIGPGGAGAPIQLPDVTVATSPADLQQQEGDPGSLLAIKFAARALALLLLLAVAAVAVSLVARFRRAREVQGPAVTRSPVGSVAEDAGSWLRRWLPGRSGEGARRQRGIFALYDELLARCRARGRPRPGHATPREFAPVLRELFRSPVTDDITRAFEDAYYGRLATAEEDVARLRERWEEVAGG